MQTEKKRRFSMEIIRTKNGLSELTNKAKSEGKTVALVPTMGALHAGHLSLIERARKECDFVTVSVFVNPTQFNNANDLVTYPRTEDADCKLLDSAGVDVAFIPSVEEIYPEPDTRVFDLGEVANVMEGPMRPGHFNGVAQIVSKLFEMVNPDKAYFGEKDFQQIAVIRRMVQICGFNLEIVSCPIKREADGLALSSRNVRLTPEGRKTAPVIYKTLQESVEYSKNHSLQDTKSFVVNTLNSISGLDVEYYEIVDAITMQPINDWKETQNGVQGCITVYCGDVRLIDNIKYL